MYSKPGRAPRKGSEKRLFGFMNVFKYNVLVSRQSQADLLRGDRQGDRKSQQVFAPYSGIEAALAGLVHSRSARQWRWRATAARTGHSRGLIIRISLQAKRSMACALT